MLALLLMGIVIIVPFVLWIVGKVDFIVPIIFLVFFGPSIVIAVHYSIKYREWPKIARGPGIRWGRKWGDN